MTQPDVDEAMERTCIVSRTAGEPHELIRFVAGPDGVVIADLKGRLPGRGAWVTARRDVVEQAVAKRLFARALKRDVTVAGDLADQVAAQLRRAALEALALARKAGLAAPGFDQVEAALRRGSAGAWLSAIDAAEDGVRKLRNAAAAGGAEAELVQAFRADEQGAIFGRDEFHHIALLPGGATDMALGAIRRFLAYDAETAKQ